MTAFAAVEYAARLAAVERVLVVGDGTFEFAHALAEAVSDTDIKRSGWLVATALDAVPADAETAARCAALVARGATVRHGVDATALDHDGSAFDAIVFNFPYFVAPDRRPRIDDNRALLARFFAAAVPVLARAGTIYVALARGQGGTPADAVSATRPKASATGCKMPSRCPFFAAVQVDKFDARRYENSWRVVDAAAGAGLVLSEAGPPAFPGGYAPAGRAGRANIVLIQPRQPRGVAAIRRRAPRRRRRTDAGPAAAP